MTKVQESDAPCLLFTSDESHKESNSNLQCGDKSTPPRTVAEAENEPLPCAACIDIFDNFCDDCFRKYAECIGDQATFGSNTSNKSYEDPE